MSNDKNSHVIMNQYNLKSHPNSLIGIKNITIVFLQFIINDYFPSILFFSGIEIRIRDFTGFLPIFFPIEEIWIGS